MADGLSSMNGRISSHIVVTAIIPTECNGCKPERNPESVFIVFTSYDDTRITDGIK